jgi:hypothetical protein
MVDRVQQRKIRHRLAVQVKEFSLLAPLAIVAILTSGAHPGVVNDGLRGNVTPRLDPVPTGTVAVVASGAPVDGEVAVIVQNGTAGPVNSVRVRGTAMPANGGPAISARTATLVPAVLAPGEYGLGVLDFRKDALAPDAEIAFDVTSAKAKSPTDPALLAVSDFRLSSPLTGSVAQRLDLTVTNPGTRAVRGPLTVTVMCFGESARPATVSTVASKRSRLAAGTSLRMSVPFASLCPSYQVGARAA